MNPRSNLSLFTFLCLATPLLAQGEIDLRTTAKKGNSVWLVQETKQEQTIDMGGQQMESSTNTSRIVQVTVKDVDDKGHLIVESKIARVMGSMTMPMGMGDFEFDSAAKADDGGDEEGMAGMGAMMKKAMMAGAGKSFTAKVSPLGKVVELLDGAAEIMKSSEGGMMGGSSMDEGALKQIVENAFGLLPEKPMAVGAKWEHKQKESGGRMPMEHKVELTLAKADAETFEVTATGTVDKPADAKKDDKEETIEGDEQQAMAREMMKSMKVKNGKMSGKMSVSRRDGFVVEATNTITMDVEMTAGPMGEMQMAMKMSTSTKRSTAEAAVPAKKEEPKKEEAKKEAGK